MPQVHNGFMSPRLQDAVSYIAPSLLCVQHNLVFVPHFIYLSIYLFDLLSNLSFFTNL